MHTFFWRWFHRLPTPFTADDLQAGYAYELAFRQFEVSDTRVFDRPQTGRAFFEGVIRDHLDLGRPGAAQVSFLRLSSLQVRSRRCGPDALSARRSSVPNVSASRPRVLRACSSL